MSRFGLLLFNLKTDARDAVLGFTTDWINALAPYFDRVRVITMERGLLDVAENVSVTSIGRELGWSEPRRALAFYRALHRATRDGRMHACFAHMTPVFLAMAAPLLRWRRIPATLWYAHKSVTPVLRIATRSAEKVVTSSVSGFRIETPKRVVVGQGIDIRRFRPAADHEPSAFELLYVGRISRVKRLDVLLDTVARLPEHIAGRPVALKIVGGPLTELDTAYERDLRARVQALGLAGRVDFAGPLPFHRVHEAYAGAACLVNPSETGSVDKTVLEAMSCGLPIVTSNPAFAEVLEPELARVWFVADAEGSMFAARVLELARMAPVERSALGFRLRAIVERDHSLEALAAKIAGVIHSTMGAAA